MDLLSLIGAYGALAGAHTGGHFHEAGQQGIPISLNMDTLSESWPLNAGSSKDRTRMNGAGFETQDSVTNALNIPAISLANALYKGLYASNLVAGKNLAYPNGDIGGIKEHSGNKYVKPMLVASSLADLMKANNPEQRWGLQFHVRDGAPGLLFNYKW